MRKYLKNLDLWIYVIPVILTITGIIVIYSLVYAKDAEGLMVKQIIALSLGIISMIVLSILDYRQLKNFIWPMYVIGLILLIIVDVFGVTSGGATRWLLIGPLQLQPSEIFKFISIIFWASYFSDKIGEINFKNILFAFIFFTIPLLIVLKQPDLGTALVISFTMLVTLFWIKLSKKMQFLLWLFILLIPIVAYLSVNNYPVFGKLLKGYQRARIEVFLDPSKDTEYRGYNVRQAIIAVGSGGLAGHGLGQGSQSQLQFLPKSHTDFIFAGFAEAFGFLGSVILISLLGLLLIRIIRVANLSKDSFGLLIAVGGAAMIFFQVVVNIGMNIGLLPVTGIPLPFLSYGGNALVVTFATLGVIQSVLLRHKKIIF